MLRHIFTYFIVLALANVSVAQEMLVQGVVSDIDTDALIEFVTVYIQGTNTATETNADGYYEIAMPVDGGHTLVFSRIGYQDASTEIRNVAANRTRIINASLVAQTSDINVVITDSRIEDLGIVSESVEEFKKLPTVTGNLESVLPALALGTTSGTGGELSSQYNVRGGNYDENLIYVNDFEIFRPQLVRSGQQEGLTFANIDLTRDLSFSSGGFQSKYGDKLSSVLDVSYKRPEEFGGSVSASLLGASAHIEGKTKSANHPIRFLAGGRYKTTQYLLNSLDVSGEYVPQFYDAQAYVTYDMSPSWQMAVIGNYNSSAYSFIPQSGKVALGYIGYTLNLNTAFDGSEYDRFINGMGGVSFTYLPERDKNPFFLKFLASSYWSEESETFDILGYYRLAQVEKDLETNETNEIAVLGIGTQHQYARNYLNSNIYNVQHKGGYEIQVDGSDSHTHFLQWGVKAQQETFDDRLLEWERIDSAGYSLPFDQEQVQLNYVIASENETDNLRFSGYVQDTYTFTQGESAEYRITGGTRFTHWTYNNQFLVSPRLEILYKPLQAKSNIAFKLAGGVYQQPPLYRDIRLPDGSLSSTDIRAQKSYHAVAGMTLDFPWRRISDKPFKLIAEAYYKKLDDLISYDVNNVKIRYSGTNDATGHVIGLDVRVNGEFVPGAESWINVSILSARESLNGVQHYTRKQGEEGRTAVNTVPRPTDRRANVSVFFQDYLPGNERFRVQTNINVGSGLPFGVNGDNIENRNSFRFKMYNRVDMGFSYAIWDEKARKKRPNHFFRFAKRSTISLNVYNLMDVNNVAANTWIKTIYNTQYAIPNNLTSRRISLKWKVEF